MQCEVVQWLLACLLAESLLGLTFVPPPLLGPVGLGRGGGRGRLLGRRRGGNLL